MSERKHYLDNIRWITLCFVILYHVFYIFNTSGVVSNIGVTGIKDRAKKILVPSLIRIFVYGWINGWTTNYYNDIFAGSWDMIASYN